MTGRSSMKFSRREFLKLGLAGGMAIALPFGASACSGPGEGSTGKGSTGTLLRSRARLPRPFTVPLPVPEVLKPVRSDAGGDHYEVVQKAGRQEILPGLKTEVWGYDGAFPGSTVEARSGRPVVIRQWNELPVPVATHRHGGETPPKSDGYPTDLILPKGHRSGSSAHAGHGSVGGDSHFFKDYRYPNEQRAATLWYHDHRMDF